MPERAGITLRQAFNEVPELEKERFSSDTQVVETLKYAQTLEGSVRHTGLHACGIVIGRDDLIEHIPVIWNKDAKILVTQFDGKHIESVGMLKMDLLGLKTLSIINDAVKILSYHATKISSLKISRWMTALHGSCSARQKRQGSSSSSRKG